MPHVYEFIISEEKIQDVLETIKTRYPNLRFEYLKNANRIYAAERDNLYILSHYLIPCNYVRRIG